MQVKRPLVYTAAILASGAAGYEVTTHTAAQTPPAAVHSINSPSAKASITPSLTASPTETPSPKHQQSLLPESLRTLSATLLTDSGTLETTVNHDTGGYDATVAKNVGGLSVQVTFGGTEQTITPANLAGEFVLVTDATTGEKVSVTVGDTMTRAHVAAFNGDANGGNYYQDIILPDGPNNFCNFSTEGAAVQTTCNVPKNPADAEQELDGFAVDVLRFADDAIASGSTNGNLPTMPFAAQEFEPSDIPIPNY